MALRNLSAVIQISRTGRQLAIDSLVAGALLLGTLAPAYAEAAAPSLIGHYSNQVWDDSEDPHALSGYSLDLYRQGKVVFGRIAVAVGSPEPVSAKLYDVSLNEKTKVISFKAKYSEGSHAGKNILPEKRDAKVILTFSGKLDPRGVRGEFVHRDGYPPFAISGKEKSLLPKQDDKYVPSSFEEWNQMFGEPDQTRQEN
ncbi:hypothetical protein [Massilia eburnea]|uniref:hypothetical protein n=1 Tax=Massilia eburnea TaxID=1776165 RepID=UPI003D6B5C12